MRAVSTYRQTRPELRVDGEKLQSGLARLVLSLVEVLREVVERQAVKRVESGSLTEAEVERLGKALMAVKRTVGEVAEQLGVKREELGLGLKGAGMNSNVALADLLDAIIDKGPVVVGQARIAVAEVDLVELNLLLSLSSVEALRRKSP